MLSQHGAGAQPARFGKEMRGDRGRMFEPLPHRHFLGIGLVVVGPVDEERLSDKVFTWGRTPEPAVVAVVPVVTHHKKVIGRNTYWAEIIAAGDFLRIDVHGVRFVKLAAVDV